MTTASENAPQGIPHETDAKATQSNAPARALRRSTDDRILGGVCGGLARYFGVDVILMRLLFLVFAFIGGSAAFIYLILWLVVPEERPGDNVNVGTIEGVDFDFTRGWQALGFGLVLIGAATLVQQLFPGLNDLIWPIAVIVAGVALIVHAGAKR
jgi:phage shock protein C